MGLVVRSLSGAWNRLVRARVSLSPSEGPPVHRGVALAACLLVTACSPGAAVEGGEDATTLAPSSSPSAAVVLAEYPAVDCPEGSHPIGLDDAWEAVVPPATSPTAALEAANTRWFRLGSDDRVLQGPTVEEVQWLAIQRKDGAVVAQFDVHPDDQGTRLVLAHVCQGAAAKDRLLEARGRWTAAQLDDYRLTVTMECFCPVLGPTAVDVKDGVPSIASMPDEAVRADVATQPLTIDEAFDYLDRFADADRFDVDFHEELGYPMSANIDPDAGTADDEFTLDLRIEVP